MTSSDRYTNLYSGTEILVLGLKHHLDENGIPSIIKNDFNAGNIGASLGGTPNTVRIMVKESDYENAMAILEDYNAG